MYRSGNVSDFNIFQTSFKWILFIMEAQMDLPDIEKSAQVC
jgi:hypothetical protein